MDPLPLITKTRSRCCADVSNVVREVFQEILAEDTYTDHTLETIQNYRTDNNELQKCADNAGKAFEQHKVSITDIGKVEKTIMSYQGGYIKRSAQLSSSPYAMDSLVLRRQPIFKDLSSRTTEKYALIQSDHLLPPLIERTIDFTLCDSQREHFKDHLEGSQNSILECTYKHRVPSSCIGGKTPLKPVSLPSLEPKNICYKSKFKPLVDPLLSELDTHLRVEIMNSSMKKTKKNLLIPKPVKLITEPEFVLFYDYQRNVTYEQTVKLRNVGTSLTRFQYSLAPEDPRIVILWNCKTTSLAPGMFTTFDVRFRTDTFDDVLEYVFIGVMGARDVVLKIMSMRETPLLMGILYYGPSSFDVVKRNFSTMAQNNHNVLNSTIDCKPCFIGNCNKFSLLLENNGSPSSFFILSEHSWHHMFVNDLNTEYELEVKPFKVFPSYFTLKVGGIAEIVINFSPQDYGFQIIKLYILCDNCAYDNLDLIGDGMYYEASFVNLKLPSKRFSVDIDSDFDTDYVLDMGSVLFHNSSRSTIQVVNSSVMKLTYRWKLRRPEIFMNPKTAIRSMRRSWIKLEPVRGLLLAENEFQFTITVTGKCEHPGDYRYILEFYITDIPEQCLQDEHNFTVEETDNYSETNLVDILIGEVELWLECVKITIFIDPCLIEVRGELLRVNDPPLRKRVNVHNMVNFDLFCVWQKVKNTKILSGGPVYVTPMSFVLPARAIVPCEIVIQALEYAYIEELFVCQVNDGKTSMQLLVKADVAVPTVAPSVRVLNFGCVKYGTKAKKALNITNNAEIGLEWCVTEYVLNLDNKHLTKANHTYLNADKGYFCHKGSVSYLEYDLFTQKEGKWCSILVINTTVSSLRRGSDFVLVYADIVLPMGGIYAPAHKTATLVPPLSFVGVERSYRVSLRNHAPVAISYAWGEPEGADINYLTVSMWPATGTIQELHFSTIFITVKPRKAGEISDFAIPCFIGRTTMPMMLYIEMHVTDVHVIFQFAHEISYKVLWPPVPIPSTMSITSALSLTESYSELHSEEITPVETTFSPKLTASAALSQYGDEDEELPITYPSGMTWTTYSSRSSYESLRKDVVKSESVDSALLFCRNLEHDERQYDNMYLELLNIPLRTPTKRTLIIRNDTPVNTDFRLDVKNFKESDDPDEPSLIERINDQLKGRTRDEWAFRLPVGVGFMLVVEPFRGEIAPFGVSEIDVWVYADTWGIYFDEIICWIPRLPPFNISVLAQILGHPIMFPIAALNEGTDANLRFGSYRYGNVDVKRKLKIKNTACIPITLIWHVFIKSVNNVTIEQPFNLLADIYTGPISGLATQKLDCITTEFDLSIRPYYGEERTTIINVKPKEIDLNPSETVVVDVIFSTKNIEPVAEKMAIHAVLVGNIKITRKDSFCLAQYKRSVGIAMDPVKVNVFVDVEMPLVQLELVRSDVTFKVWASTVISAVKGFVAATQTLNLRNPGVLPIKAKISTTPPFRILCSKSCNGSVKAGKGGAHVDVDIPGKSCAEVLIECHVTACFVNEVSRMITHDSSANFRIENKTIIIDRILVIDQPFLIEQTVPLELQIGYPEISISTDNVEFGPVFVGSEKCKIVSLVNRTTEQIGVKVIVGQHTPEFIIEPRSALLAPAIGTECMPFDFYVYFKPTKSKHYQEVVTFATCIDSYWQDIQLSGVGSLNSKFYAVGI